MAFDPYGKPTFQAQSAPGDIDHLKIIGGKGDLSPGIWGQKLSVNTTPLIVGNRRG
ncbi:MAG: hypothetical protein WCD04_05385 [Terriglobia bacterium]